MKRRRLPPRSPNRERRTGSEPLFCPRMRSVIGEDRVTRILLVGHDRNSAAHLAAALGPGDFQFEYADASQAVKEVSVWQPALVMLDIPLPDSDSISLYRLLRQTCRTSIVVCSMSGREEDVVLAFDAGVDDYLVMPMRPVELTARVRAVLRRTTDQGVDDARQDVLVAGDLEIRTDEHRVYRSGSPIDLSPIEFRLLLTLVREAGRAVPHSKLLSNVWGPEYVDCRHYLRLYISYLRSKIEENPEAPELILNEWGVGYRFEPKLM